MSDNKMFASFEKFVSKTCHLLINIGAVLLFVLMVQAAGDVILRYVFNSPISGTTERNQILLALIVFFGWGYSQLENKNVKVDILLASLPHRFQMMANILATFLSLILFCLMAWQALVAAKKYHEAGRLIDTIHIPLAPFQLFVCIGSLILCFVLIKQLIVYILKISERK